MTFIKEYPDQSMTTDITFFPSGIRLSNDFIDREALDSKQYTSIYIDEENKNIGFRFFSTKQPQSLKLTPSGMNTLGKTVSCTFLKKYDWIKQILENKNINSRRFPISKLRSRSKEGDMVEYIVKIGKQQ